MVERCDFYSDQEYEFAMQTEAEEYQRQLAEEEELERYYAEKSKKERSECYMEKSIIIPETRCTMTMCELNCEGRCNSITTLLDSLSIGGLPEPDGCSYYYDQMLNKVLEYFKQNNVICKRVEDPRPEYGDFIAIYGYGNLSRERIVEEIRKYDLTCMFFEGAIRENEYKKKHA